MFHVLVMGGIALLGAEGCGSRTDLDTASGTDAAVDATRGVGDAGVDSTFPSELPSFIDAFPSELGAPPADAGRDTSFPSELPTFLPDAGTPKDATSRPDTGFPLEA